MSRRKGSKFERDVARLLVAADGACRLFGHLASSAGRHGHLDLGADIFTRRFAAECKHRQSIAGYLWAWLDHIAARTEQTGHIPILVLKRDRERPLVVIELDQFLHLLERPRP